MDELNFKTTKEIKIDKEIVTQVIGQDSAVEIIKKAANQRRHVLLIGEPGTGKSMLGLALSELLPKENLVDIVLTDLKSSGRIYYSTDGFIKLV